MPSLDARLLALEYRECAGRQLPEVVPDDWTDAQIAALAQRTGRAVYRATDPALLELFV